MDARRQIGMLLVALFLLATAWLIPFQLAWSATSNFTVPWFCTALALAILIVLLVSTLRGQAPGELPWPVVVTTTLGVGVILGVGIEVDAATYELPEITGSRFELLGFALILLGVFAVSRPFQRP